MLRDMGDCAVKEAGAVGGLDSAAPATPQSSPPPPPPRAPAGPGWWLWATVPAAFLIHAVICGVGYSAGVYYFRVASQFGENHAFTSCVGSLVLAMMAVAGDVPCGDVVTLAFAKHEI